MAQRIGSECPAHLVPVLPPSESAAALRRPSDSVASHVLELQLTIDAMIKIARSLSRSLAAYHFVLFEGN